MALLSLQLPAPAANGSGTVIDVSLMGANKTVTVSGSWSLTPNITIEVNNDPAQAGSWAALETLQGGGFFVVDVACMWMRARVSNFKSGQAPVVWVASDDTGTTFAVLAAPAGNGAGVGVDVSALGIFKTVQVGGTFRGEAIVEISEDGGVTWAQPFAFQSSGIASLIISADFMRVKRNGVPTIDPGLPIVNVASTSSGGGGGAGGGLVQVFEYVADGTETNPFTVPLPAARASVNYGVQITLSRPLANAIKIVSVVDGTFTVNGFDVELSADIEANDVLQITVEDLT